MRIWDTSAALWRWSTPQRLASIQAAECCARVPSKVKATHLLEGLDMPPHGQTVGYARVSSTDQNLARQLEAIGKVDRLFHDKITGKSRADRNGLRDCLAYIRDGDTVLVASMDRLARSLIDLQQIVDEILTKGASVTFIKEKQSYSRANHDPMGRLLLQILGSFAEFERNLIRERQAEGIKLAKEAGKYTGRRRALTPDQVVHAREQIALGVPKAHIARQLGVDRTTLYRTLATGSASSRAEGST